MNRKYQLGFLFRDTEDEAKQLCESLYKFMTPYARRKYKPSYTPWTSMDGKEHKFVVWYAR